MAKKRQKIEGQGEFDFTPKKPTTEEKLLKDLRFIVKHGAGTMIPIEQTYGSSGEENSKDVQVTMEGDKFRVYADDLSKIALVDENGNVEGLEGPDTVNDVADVVRDAREKLSRVRNIKEDEARKSRNHQRANQRGLPRS